MRTPCGICEGCTRRSRKGVRLKSERKHVEVRGSRGGGIAYWSFWKRIWASELLCVIRKVLVHFVQRSDVICFVA